MSSVYFDSSAFVKLLVEEAGSDLAADLWSGADHALSSRLAYPEVRAALAAAQRSGRLDARGHADARQAWERLWIYVDVLELTAVVAAEAGRLALDFHLGGADAVHLASGLAVSDGLVFAVWDTRLRTGAQAAGLVVTPAAA